MAEFGWLWGANGEGDDQEVTHESGAGRLCKSILGVCVSPCLMLAVVLLLGWNERRAVCTAKAIIQGKDVVKKAGCSDANKNDGDLVMFSCKISDKDLQPLSPSSSDFSSYVAFKGTGLKTEAEMLQCVESSSSQTKKDNVGGGKTTITTYSYSVQWTSSPVDSHYFKKLNSQNFKANCGGHNPSWPASLPKSQTILAKEVPVESYVLDEESYIRSIPLDEKITITRLPSGWQNEGAWYVSSKWQTGSGSYGMGRVRVRFYGNNWKNPMVTVLGKNKGGRIDEWKAKKSWLCKGFKLGTLSPGKVSKDDLFKGLKSGNTIMTWFIRLCGWLLMWLAFYLLAGPLEVAADCIPCIGPYLGDSVSCVACCVSCLPACACSSIVICIVWVVMRPLITIPLMIACSCVCCGLCVFKGMSKKEGGKSALVGEPAVTYGVEEGQAA